MVDRSGGAGFPDTRPSVIELLRSDAAEVRRGAFDALARGYWRPAYEYVRLRWGLSSEDAEDTVQGFFATAYDKGWLERFDPAQARFRTFVRTCLDRFAMNQRKAAGALKRGGGATLLSLDGAGAEHEVAHHAPGEALDPEEMFRREFVRALFAEAVDRVRDQCHRTGREAVFRLFERYDLGPQDKITYAELGRSFGLPLTQVTNHLAAARRMFRTAVMSLLRRVCGSDDEFRREARELLGIEVP